MVERAAERAALVREIQLAQAVQAELLPPRGARAFGRLAVIGSWRPATSCAGDFGGVYPLDDDRTLVAIGDVTGHGIAAAMVTAAAVGACDAAARRAGGDLDLQDLASALDLAVRRVGGGQLAMTCFASVIDQKANTIRYVSCGHTAPYVLRSGAEKPELQALVGRGNPLGSGAPAVDRYKVLERTLDPGDLVVWYTDGVIDAKDPSGKPFGDRRLQQLLRRLSASAAVGVHDALHASLAAHRAGQPLADDETVVVAQLGAVPA
jgi:sigma-B regulation protein RsbU (phosphoserine phosphatase)